MFHVLVRYRARALWNVIRFSTPRERILLAVLLVLSALLALAVYAGFGVVVLFRGAGPAANALAHEMVLSVFLFMLAGSVPFLAATLLQPGDAELLGAAPVPPRSVVTIRLLEGTAAGMMQFLPIGAPAIVACAVVLGAPALFWPLLLILGAVAVLLPAFVAATVVLAAVHWLGAGRTRQAVASANVVLGAAVCLVIVNQVMGLRLQEGLAGVVTGSANPSGPVAFAPPWSWLGSALLAIAHGDIRAFGANIGLAAFTTAVLAAVAVSLGERVLVRDGDAGHTVSGPRPRRTGQTEHAPGLLSRMLPPPLAAMVRKEILYILRDPLLLSQAGMPSILFLVPFVMSGNASLGPRISADEFFAFSVLLILAVLYMQASILSASAIGLEGRAYWTCMAAPTGPWTTLTAKWITSWMLSGSAACAMIGIAGLAFRAELTDVVFLWLAGLASAAGLCGIGVGVSAALPRFTFENPAHRVSPSAMVIGFGAGVAYAAVGWGTLGLTWFASMHWPAHAALLHRAGLSLFAVATLVAAIVPMAVGVRRLMALEWEF